MRAVDFEADVGADPGLRVLVCGGRDFGRTTGERDLMAGVLHERRDSIGLVITGGASGADSYAKSWAERAGIAVAVFDANWEVYGKRAGPIRNGWMIEFGKPDLVIAFPGGRGTAGMVRQARASGVNVQEVAP